MALLAYPVQLVNGGSYDQSTLVEQLVIAAPRQMNWREFDSRITQVCEAVGGLWVLSVPTFKPFTQLLVKMARELPVATVLQISNQAVVQVRVEICQPYDGGADSTSAALSSIKNLPGCEINFEFHYPHVGGDKQPRTQVSLAVKVPFLLNTLRRILDTSCLTVVQVYDFWE